MKVFSGTSGFSYKEWKGTFYPGEISSSEMLAYYSSQLPAVEINNTFYRIPKDDILESWASRTPDDFRFALKASRRITHFKRFLDTGDTVEYMYSRFASLGPKLGAVLFQLPPNFSKNVERLESFLSVLPERHRAAIEFRHDSWYDEEVFSLLRKANCALCIADDTSTTPFIETADWGFLRLRRPDYSTEDLEDWASMVASSEWTDVFVFFKHEEAGAGPRMASDFLSCFSTPTKRELT